MELGTDQSRRYMFKQLYVTYDRVSILWLAYMYPTEAGLHLAAERPGRIAQQWPS